MIFKAKKPKETGTLPDQIRTLRNYCYEMFTYIEKVFSSEKKEESGRLPEGTVIIRCDDMDNAGMDYGTWEKSDTVVFGEKVYLTYIRVR